jgi:hypothetical protein
VPGIGYRIGQFRACMAGLTKEEPLNDSSLPAGLRNAHVSGAFIVDDPGSGGTFSIKTSGGRVVVDSGTRYLPVEHAGVELWVSATGSVTIKQLNEETVATLTDGRTAHCKSEGSGVWRALNYTTGAVDPGVDDIVTASALQDRLDEDRENGTLNRLKTGETLVTSTIDLDGGYGGVLEGYASVLADADPDDALQRQFSALTRSGAFSPMLRSKRAYTTLSNFSLFGDLMENINAGTYTDGELGILMTRDASVGTGKTQFDRLVIDGWDVGVQIGSAAGEFNCDESLWHFPSFWRCDTAFRQLSEQSLGHHFIHPHFHLFDNCFDILGGGDIQVIGGLWARHRTTANDAAFVRYRNDTLDEFGLNAGGVHVLGLKVDSQCRGVRLLDMEQASGEFDYLTTVRFDHLQMPWDNSWSNDWTGPMFFVSGATHLIIDGATVLYPDAIRWHVSAGAYAKVTVINCSQCLGTLYTDFLDTAGSTGDIQVRFWNNTASAGAEVSETLNGSSIPATVTVSA